MLCMITNMLWVTVFWKIFGWLVNFLSFYSSNDLSSKEPTVLFNMSKLRMYAITAINVKQGMSPLFVFSACVSRTRTFLFVTCYYWSFMKHRSIYFLSVGIKKLNEFTDRHFQTVTANLLVPGGVSALNIAALHGNLEVRLSVLCTACESYRWNAHFGVDCVSCNIPVLCGLIYSESKRECCDD